MRLNVGCGRDVKEGWINLDSIALPNVDIVCDLERELIPLGDDCVDEFLMGHVIEHIAKPLPMMQELWRVAKPNALMTVRCPYGSSDDAFEDPTHVRQYFLSSFGYFGQPYYFRADYGFRGDWQAEKITLILNPRMKGLAKETVMRRVETERNVVLEMVAELLAVKPAREPLAELRVSPEIHLAVYE